MVEVKRRVFADFGSSETSKVISSVASNIMLKSLSISNLAVISHLSVDFDEGLNLLTGETGAGKSIIVDAFSLLLGARAASDLVRPSWAGEP